MSVNNHGHDGVGKTVFRKDGMSWKRFVWVVFHIAPQCHISLIPVSPLVAMVKFLEQASLCPSLSETLKAGHDMALRAVKTLAESGSLRVIVNLAHLNLSWIPPLSTLPLICITLCGHIILAHYAKNNVDSISLAQNMQS